MTNNNKGNKSSDSNRRGRSLKHVRKTSNDSICDSVQSISPSNNSQSISPSSNSQSISPSSKDTGLRWYSRDCPNKNLEHDYLYGNISDKLVRKQTFYDFNYTYWYPAASTLQFKINASYNKYCAQVPYTPTKIVIESWAK